MESFLKKMGDIVEGGICEGSDGAGFEVRLELVARDLIRPFGAPSPEGKGRF
jgi:hypothetical protein